MELYTHPGRVWSCKSYQDDGDDEEAYGPPLYESNQTNKTRISKLQATERESSTTENQT